MDARRRAVGVGSGRLTARQRAPSVAGVGVSGETPVAPAPAKQPTIVRFRSYFLLGSLGSPRSLRSLGSFKSPRSLRSFGSLDPFWIIFFIRDPRNARVPYKNEEKEEPILVSLRNGLMEEEDRNKLLLSDVLDVLV